MTGSGIPSTETVMSEVVRESAQTPFQRFLSDYAESPVAVVSFVVVCGRDDVLQCDGQQSHDRGDGPGVWGPIWPSLGLGPLLFPGRPGANGPRSRKAE